MIFELSDLLKLLRNSHQASFVYRGQPKEYADYLVPTIHRCSINPLDMLKCESDLRLRKIGKYFLRELSPMELAIQWQKTMSFQEYEKHMKRITILKYIRGALGYPLCQALSQQAGINSEGLDVSSDIDVATYFATHQLKDKAYVDCISGIGIIYRFNIFSPNISWEDIKKWDFYSCPSYIPSNKIINLFQETDSIDECLHSIHVFKKEINWGPFFDLDEVREKRPFELIKFPSKISYNSRIRNQSAGLIIPDRILNKNYDSDRFRPSSVKISNNNCSFTEDILKRNGVEKFYFYHNEDNYKCINYNAEYLFPNDNIECKLAINWFSSLCSEDLIIPCFDNVADQYIWNKIIFEGYNENDLII